MEDQNTTKNCEIVVAMVPLPCQGHLNQLLHLSNLLSSCKIRVHFVGTTTHNHQAKVRLQGWDVENITNFHFNDFSLPLLSSKLTQPMINSETYFPSHLQPIFEASLNLRQPVFQLLQELSTKFKRVVVIHDSMMASVVQDVKSMSNVEAYTFIPLSVFCVFFSIWNKLDEKPFELDADVPMGLIPTREGISTLEFKKFSDYQSRFDDFQSGMIYNTCRVIEGKYVEMLQKSLPDRNLKHFALGPFNPVNVKIRRWEQARHISLQWLDKQEIHSVVYVSFGSTITMTDRQISELADGLERSEQNFIWVLRNADECDIFTGNEKRNLQLPKGFENRVKDRGIVVKDWAPQLEILAHPSVGGFMSHCGWNSCMESISMGVPIAAWPMHSDQPRNSVLVTKVLGIGTMVKEWCGKPELVMSTNIEDAVRTLMISNQGLEMRKRAVALGESVRGAVAKGGACDSERQAFIAHITR